MQCKVAYCRYNTSHTTSGHKCGNCGKYGHGQHECGNNNRMHALTKFRNESLPVEHQCLYSNCTYKWNHTCDSHNCYKCGRKHSVDDCIIQSLETSKSRWGEYMNKNYEELLIDEDNIYVSAYVGMGCQVYIRKKQGIFSTIFMHSDSWGQYGPATSDEPIYNKFILGLDNRYDLLTVIEKECPLCRTVNTKKQTIDIKGSEEQCKVCYDHVVEKFFTGCGHACVCSSCYELLPNKD